MTPDDLRQITDAVYYVAHSVKMVGSVLIVFIAVVGWLNIITRK